MKPLSALARLSEAQRTDWIRTVLTVNGTRPQRMAFIDGYNGVAMTGRYSPQMKEAHALGVRVRTILETPDVDAQ